MEQNANTDQAIQINLQHYRIGTDNLMKINEDSTDVLYIQEPYTIQTKMAGI
jgi:predicted methyltransferase